MFFSCSAGYAGFRNVEAHSACTGTARSGPEEAVPSVAQAQGNVQ